MNSVIEELVIATGITQNVSGVGYPRIASRVPYWGRNYLKKYAPKWEGSPLLGRAFYSLITLDGYCVEVKTFFTASLAY